MNLLDNLEKLLLLRLNPNKWTVKNKIVVNYCKCKFINVTEVCCKTGA